MENKTPLIVQYALEKPHDDPDMVFFVDKNLREAFTAIDFANKFICDPRIVSIKNTHSAVQRVFINQFIMETLLKYRSSHPLNVSEALMLLINDATVNDWFKILREYVFPFMKKNNII